MKTLLWIIPLGLFCALASFAHGTTQPLPVEHGYSVAESARIGDMLEQEQRMAWKDANAAKLADAYGLTPESLDNAMDKIPCFKLCRDKKRKT